jgi:NAD(P)-dependent dehydrogenase (short-subunit alcohol dehydrogenase family)
MGRLMARRLAADGTEVAAVDVDADGLAGTADLSPTISPLVCDVTDAAAVDELVGWVEKELGPIGRVVAAAGIAPTAPLAEQPTETILRAMDVNYGGVVRVVKAALPAMVDRGTGEIVVLASLAGWMPAPSLGAYSATKHALVAFCEVLAHELRDSGLKVACVCPPLVDTPMIRQLEEGGVTSHRKVTPLPPQVVVDAVERALAAGELVVFPGRGTKAMVRTRRLAPAALWKLLDRA